MRAIDVHISLPPAEVHRIDQPNEPKDVVSVQVADKYMADFVGLSFKTQQLHLSTLSAINQEVLVFQLQQLTGRMPSVSRSS